MAHEVDVEIFEIELICTDTVEHRRRIESRIADIPDHALPDWKSVLERQYDPWDRDHIVLDTAKISADHVLSAIIKNFPLPPPSSPRCLALRLLPCRRWHKPFSGVRRPPSARTLTFPRWAPCFMPTPAARRTASSTASPSRPRLAPVLGAAWA